MLYGGTRIVSNGVGRVAPHSPSTKILNHLLETRRLEFVVQEIPSALTMYACCSSREFIPPVHVFPLWGISFAHFLLFLLEFHHRKRLPPHAQDPEQKEASSQMAHLLTSIVPQCPLESPEVSPSPVADFFSLHLCPCVVGFLKVMSLSLHP